MSTNFKNLFGKNDWQNFFRNNLQHIYTVLIALVFFGFGFYVATGLNNRSLNFFSAVAANNSMYIPAILEEVKSNLENKFIFWKATSTLPTTSDLNYGMVKGYVAAYNDPHTMFFTPQEAKLFTENIKGEFGGIGAQVDMKDGQVIVFAPLEGSPAEKAGIKAGDIIISVNSTSTLGMSVEQVVHLIRGEKGTGVNLEILHKGDQEISKLSIIRDVIKVPEIKTEIIDEVFVIHFYSFTANSVVSFAQALQKFLDSGKNRLLVDLRGNGGGYLEAAINITSFFLNKDQIVVVEKGNKTDGDKIIYSRGFNYFNPKVLKLVVLIDGYSASASEILAGALKENNIAKVVGEKSYGKGSVQQMETLSDGSAIKMTVAKWYTPKGVNISEAGIVPDLWATSTSATTSITHGTSTKIINLQLKKAIDILLDMK